MRLSKWILVVLAILFLAVVGVSAQDLQFSNSAVSASINHIGGYAVTYTDIPDNISVTQSMMVDESTFGIAYVGPSVMSTSYGTGTSQSNSDVFVTHTRYSGNNTLKGTIVLKSYHVLTFPLSLGPNENLIAFPDNTWKVVNASSGNTMNGITIAAPTVSDANGTIFHPVYTYSGGVLTLVYNNATPIAFPCVIDPTWTSYNGHYLQINGNQYIEMWNQTGTTTWVAPAGVTSVAFLVVAGGANGGAGAGGGGGAGGLLTSGAYAVTPGNSYTVTVGSANSNSVFGANTANYGGTGGAPGGVAGGSGGGGGGTCGGGSVSYSGGAGTAGQGSNGGYGAASSNSNQGCGSGGGGGAGSNGGSLYGSSTNTGANGGSGIYSSITGSSVCYAGGGGGGGYMSSASSGGCSPGGAGGVSGSAGTAGNANTGSGGGSGGAAGASGIVVIAYTGPPVVSQFVSNFAGGTAPVSVTFTDESTNYPTFWNWTYTEYINGVYSSGPTIFSTSQNPTRSFGSAGINTEDFVVDIAGTSGIYNYSVQNTWINTTGIVASFTQNLTKQNVPQTVQFTDISTGSPSSWAWNFGDGPNYYNASLVLLLHNNLSTFNDSSPSNAIPVISGNISLGPGKFNGGMTSSDSVPGTYVAYPNSSNYAFGTGAFTISGYAKGTSPVLATKYTGGYAPFLIYVSGGRWLFNASSTGSSWDIASGAVIGTPTGNFDNIVVERFPNGTFFGYENGVLGSGFPIASASSLVVNSQPLQIGGVPGYGGYLGTVDEIAIWKGVAIPITSIYPQVSEIQNPFPTNQAAGQNPVHTFTLYGTNSINETVYDAFGGFSQATGTFTGTLGFPSASCNIPTPATQPNNGIFFVDTTLKGGASGFSENWSFGDSAGTQPFSNTIGSQTHVYNYGGVFNTLLTATNANGTSTANCGQVTISLGAPSQNTWWTPHTVQITVMSDSYGTRLPGVTINAMYNVSAMPVAWINELYGIQASASGDIINSSIILGGVTGSDGTMTTTMLGSLKYDIVLNAPAYGIVNYRVSSYPSDSMLNIYVPVVGSTLPTSGNNTYQQMNGSRAYTVQPNISFTSECLDYLDSSGTTSTVTETWWYGNNDSVIQNVTFSPGTSLVTNCYTSPNIRGTRIYWLANGTRSP